MSSVETIEQFKNIIITFFNIDADLKVDVHRKNSSESIEMLFYPPSLVSGNSQQDQQSLAGSVSVTKSIRSTNAPITGALSVYPEHESEHISNADITAHHNSTLKPGANSSTSINNATARHMPHLLRKSSEEFKRRRQRRRLERQGSLDAAAESCLANKLIRNQSDTIATSAAARCSDNFLHPQDVNAAVASKSASASKMAHNTLGTIALGAATQRTATTITATTTLTLTSANATPTATTNMSSSSGSSGAAGGGAALNASTALSSIKSTRLQRHRSSETHEERIKQQNRSLFLPIHHEHQPHHVSSGASSSSALAAIVGDIMDGDDLELDGLGGSASGMSGHVDTRARVLQPWILG